MRASRFATLISALTLVALVANHFLVGAGVVPDAFFAKLDNLAVDFGFLLLTLLWAVTFFVAFLWLNVWWRFGRSKSDSLARENRLAVQSFKTAGLISSGAIALLVVGYQPLFELQAPAGAPGYVVMLVRFGHFVADYGYVLVVLFGFAIFIAVSLGFSWRRPAKVATVGGEEWVAEP